jgi:Uma2 family endonuclease
MAEPADTMGCMRVSEQGITLAEHYAAGEDRGVHRELVDGVLIVSPFASRRHALAALRLQRILDGPCPPELLVLGTINVDQEPATNLQPDVTVTRAADLDAPATEGRPLLVVEILSPSTRRFDLTLKRQIYAEMGIPSYWLIDIKEPSVLVLELARPGAYEERARFVGDEVGRLDRPFPVTFAAADLVQAAEL